MTAYQGLLQEDNFPFYALYIQLDPKHIDVNVHPTKTEVKFDDERGLYALVLAAVRQALGTHNITPSLDFEYDINFGMPLGGGGNEAAAFPPFHQAHEKPSPTPLHFPSSKGGFQENPATKRNLKHWESLYSEGNNESESEDGFDFGDNFPESPDGGLPIGESQGGRIEITFSSSANQRYEDKEDEVTASVGATFQVHDSYIVSKVKSGLMLMDQQAAHERILYERYLASFERRTFASQQLLFPVNFEVNPMDFALLTDLQEMLRALGFSLSLHANLLIEVFGIPTELQPGDEKKLIEGLLEQYKQEFDNTSSSKHQKLAKALAKKSAIKKGVRLEQEQMNALIEQLFACNNHNYSPDGRRIVSIMGASQIAAMLS
jgi:DNA mismatch repair protein MutL